MSSPIRLYHEFRGLFSQMSKWGRPELLETLALFMVGVFVSRDVRLGRIAAEVPLDIQEDSVAQRFRRWLKHPKVDEGVIFDPVARRLLWSLRHTRLRIQIDRTTIQDRFNILMLSVYYRKRAIPLVWTVLPKMGNSSFMAQVELLSHLNDLMPPGVTAVLLGDREFGTPDMVRTIGCYDWDYCLRVKGHTYIYLPETHQWVQLRDLAPAPGTRCYLTDVLLTKTNTSRRLHFALACDDTSDDPWFIATNLIPSRRTLSDYARRFACEEMFSDFKARGFDLERSQLQHPARLSRLILVIALLYVWIIATARRVCVTGQLRTLTYRVYAHRYSLFQIGLRWLKKQLSLGNPLIPDPNFLIWQIS
jgi:hypothetical protein